MWPSTASWSWWHPEPALWVLAAWGLDALVGEPCGPVHPVRAVAAGAFTLEGVVRRFARSPRALRLGGAATVIAVVAGTYAATLAVVALADRLSPVAGHLTALLLMATGLAGRDLADAAGRVRAALDAADLVTARRRVAELVSRDTAALPVPEVVRAAVESVAENTCDAVVAPFLWGLVGGAPLLWAYKAVNTLDSLFGYRTPRYREFGWFAARLDDAANWLPARLAALALVVAACPEGRTRAAWTVWRRDARAHASPNAGQTEAAMAGALGVRLGGPTPYHGVVVPRPTLGDAEVALTPATIPAAVRLLRRAVTLVAVLGTAVAGALGGRWW
jgi:adenosylcobinamide-phosphate synthase